MPDQTNQNSQSTRDEAIKNYLDAQEHLDECERALVSSFIEVAKLADDRKLKEARSLHNQMPDSASKFLYGNLIDYKERSAKQRLLQTQNLN